MPLKCNPTVFPIKGAFKDLRGLKFDHLFVLGLAGSNQRHCSLWKCRCDCGKEVIKDQPYLTRNPLIVKSCGCVYFQDLTGLKFGSWLVLRQQKIIRLNSYVETRWLCKCSCGREKIVSTYALQSGHSKSCGCLRGPEMAPGESGFNRLKRIYKRDAKERGFNFFLSEEQFRNLVTGDCFYCGTKPCKTIDNGTRKSLFLYNGIDRMDHKKGYEQGNVVSCCGICNRMKNVLGVEEFITHCKQIINHYENKF
jgi:hypothetical protein